MAVNFKKLSKNGLLSIAKPSSKRSLLPILA